MNCSYGFLKFKLRPKKNASGRFFKINFSASSGSNPNESK